METKVKNHNHAVNPAPLAYQNKRFLETADARTLRILAEYLEPQVRLRREGVKFTVVFFGSARVLPRDIAARNLAELEIRSKSGDTGVTESTLAQARKALQMSQYYEDARELARLITQWSLSLKQGRRFLVVCSGGGGGIMEAANRGAAEAGGKSIGLNIKLPSEQPPNPYVTPELNFLFKYFFMRKLWFAQPAKALIAFPGGFGTMDELWEFLTLMQTGKMGHRAALLLYGSKFWRRAINPGWLLECGTVNREDLNLIQYADTPQSAFEILKRKISRELPRQRVAYPFM